VAVNYRVDQNKSTPGSSLKCVKIMPEMLQKSLSSEAATCNAQFTSVVKAGEQIAETVAHFLNF